MKYGFCGHNTASYQRKTVAGKKRVFIYCSDCQAILGVVND